MAYTQTAVEFLNALVDRIDPGLPLESSPGRVEFEISGAPTQVYLLDFDTAQLMHQGLSPHCIVKASEGDFMALVEGRMSAQDGMITGRLKMSGEPHRLSRVVDALRG